MSADQQDFEALRRLLKLKRHEKPPPRYFNDFSTQILNGIRNGTPAGREDVAEQLTAQSPWLERLFGVFQSKPLFAGIFGAAVCGLLVLGIAYSERLDAIPSATDLAGTQPQTTALPQAATVFNQDVALMASSTNPIVPASGSIFDSIRISTVPQNINWKPQGN